MPRPSLKSVSRRPPRRRDPRRDRENATKAKRPPHPGEAERIAVRRVRALELKLQGASYRKIAATLHVSLSTAFADIDAELTELREQAKDDVQQVRDLEIQRCDAMTTGLWPHIKKGVPQAVMAGVRVGERRARLLGLDAPTKSEIHGSMTVDAIEIGALTRYLTDDELSRANAAAGEVDNLLAEARRRREASGGGTE